MGDSSASTAILVIDMQKGYCYPDGASVEDGTITQEQAHYIKNTIIPRIATFIDKGRRESQQIIYVCVNGVALGKNYAIVDELESQPEDKVCERWVVADSIFQEEGFQNYLLFKNFKHFIIVGVYSDKCVAKHAQEAKKAGYKVTVESSCTFP